MNDDYALGPSLEGWSLVQATGISGDGLTIVGNGVNPDGKVEAWRVVLDAPALIGDCSEDGILGVTDLACVSLIEERDAVLTALNTLPGDLDGNGEVSFEDFLVLSANFGQDLPGYTDGNIDLEDGIGFADFLVLARMRLFSDLAVGRDGRNRCLLS